MTIKNSFFGCVVLLFLGCEPFPGTGQESPLDQADGGPSGDAAADAGLVDESPGVDGGITVSADAGTEPEFQFGNAASNSFYQGSWRGAIKSSFAGDVGFESCDLLAGWNANDNQEMLRHFKDTNQNMYIQQMQWAGFNANNCDWKNFIDLGTVADLDPHDLMIFTGFDNDKGISDFEDAAVSTRQAKAQNGSGSIRGWLIDDFHERMLGPEYEEKPNQNWFLPAEVANLKPLSHGPVPGEGSLPEVDFMPYVSSHVIPVHFVPAFILGARGSWGRSASSESPDEDYGLYSATEAADGGVAIAADVAQMSTSFHLGPIGEGETFKLSFLMVEKLIQESINGGDVNVIAEINDVEILRVSLISDTINNNTGLHMDIFDGESVLLPNSSNTLTIRVEAEGNPAGKNQHKLAYIWDVLLKRSAGAPISFVVNEMTFTTSRDPARTESTSTVALLATSNEDWRIDQYIDGLFFKTMATENNFDAKVHARMLKSTCGHLSASNKLCIETFWGNEQGNTAVTFNWENVVTRFEDAQTHTDGLMVWRLENGLGHRAGGVFTQRELSDRTDYDVMAGYPNNTKNMWDWYQNWTVTASQSGDYQLDWWDNGHRDSSSDVHPDNIYKQILTDDAVVWEEDIADYDDVDGGLPTDSLASETGSEIFYVEAGEAITVGLEIQASFAYASYGAKFRLYDPEGNVVDLSAGEYRSGIGAEDWGTQGMYDCTTAYYTSHSYRDVCLAE